MAFTHNLRRLRLERFLSQAELARRAGVHALTVARLEAGATAPSSRSVRGLAEALGVDPRALATPHEVAELRRVLARPTQLDSWGSAGLDHWDDDGGAAQAVAGTRAV